MDDLRAAMKVLAGGMHAQSVRLRIISENLANADSTATIPGGEPYRRQRVHFKAVLDAEINAQQVSVDAIKEDPSPFNLVYQPGHPAANAEGYVQYPNVNTIVETLDLREANRSYEASLRSFETTRTMLLDTIDMLR